MNKQLTLLIFCSTLAVFSSYAQATVVNCYELKLQEGNDFFNKKEYGKAIEAWEQSKKCSNSSDEKDRKLDNLIKEAENMMRDDDNDGVPNVNDKCPNIYSRSSTGCPVERIRVNIERKNATADSDNDGMLDARDRCPDEKGDSEGCPDSDGDKVNDSRDKCPGMPGNDNVGCSSDWDNDGIANDKDDCDWDAARTADGCPDVDNDKVPDYRDNCGGEKGLVINHGCALEPEDARNWLKEGVEPEKELMQQALSDIILDHETEPNITEAKSILKSLGAYNIREEHSKLCSGQLQISNKKINVVCFAQEDPNSYTICFEKAGEPNWKFSPETQVLLPKRFCEVCPEMVTIVGDTYKMGSEGGKDNERPIHEVEIDSFFLGKYEVTNEQFVQFLKAEGNQVDGGVEWINLQGRDIIRNHHEEHPCRIRKVGDTYEVEQGYEKHPVVYVSWYGAVAYTRWLGRMTNKPYRLPTEAEWEFACRKGTAQNAYSWGNVEQQIIGNANIADKSFKDAYDIKSDTFRLFATKYSDGHAQLSSVGSFKSDKFGLHDMSGNVLEWCQDLWHENYNGAPSTGRAWNSNGINKYRPVRGGAWTLDMEFARSASRVRLPPAQRQFDVGFRVARSKN